jgi:uncharacterized protein YndB with AHSA1/START domain
MKPDLTVLTVTRRFSHSAERVFDAWLDPVHAGRWWFATPTGRMKQVEIDGRVGGKFMIVDRRGDIDAEHFGTFVVLDRPRRLVFDFATDREEKPTRVTVDIVALEDGGCELTLSHAMSPEWAEYKDRAMQGWTMILEGLATTLRAPAPEDSPLRVRRSVLINATPDVVWRAFETKERMGLWWGALAGTPQAGTSQGQWLDDYEPREGRHIRMSVMMDGARASYGGTIRVFAPSRELTFENDWIPNRGWAAPTFVTLRLTPALAGTLIELFHHGFERTGGDFAATHAGYEQGWGMTQLLALKRYIETGDDR